MIKNERQYRITRSQAQKFQAAIRELEETRPAKNVSPALHKAQIDALRSQLADLEEEIAGGLSQEQLAERLGLKPQQIQRYEATEYRAASLTRVVEVARALRVPVRKGLLPSEGEVSVARMCERLTSAGLSTEFVKQRL